MTGGNKQLTGWALAAFAVAIVLAFMAQHALAAGAARVIADIWVSAVSVVLKLFASLFGRH